MIWQKVMIWQKWRVKSAKPGFQFCHLSGHVVACIVWECRRARILKALCTGSGYRWTSSNGNEVFARIENTSSVCWRISACANPTGQHHQQYKAHELVSDVWWTAWYCSGHPIIYSLLSKMAQMIQWIKQLKKHNSFYFWSFGSGK